MSMTMTDPIQHIPPESGWYAAAALGLLGLLKAALPWLKSRDAAHHRYTKEERDAQRAEERDLVVTLKARLELVEGEVKQLRDERVADKVMIASLTGKLDHAEAEKARLRTERDHYRQIATAGGLALADSRPDAAKQILDEISEADDATSQAGGKK